ncbi:MAG TPA: hypothetical protein DIW27_04260, partial [Cytophagales bacterium]|nr:hypothetical protein [Cytophagales bacterium]
SINNVSLSSCNKSSSSSITKIGGRYWYFDCTLGKNQFTRDVELPVTFNVGLGGTDSQSITGRIYFGSGTYSDVNSTSWASPYIRDGTNYGLFKGIGNGKFSKSTETPVTRGQVAKIIHDIKLKLGKYATETSLLTAINNGRFSDVTTDHPFFPHIQALRNAGAISAGTTFRPDVAVNRGEFAKMLIEGLNIPTNKPKSETKKAQPTGDLSQYVIDLNKIYVEVAAYHVDTLIRAIEPVYTGCEGFSPCDVTKPVTRYEMARAFTNVYKRLLNGTGSGLSKTANDISNYSVIGDKFEGTEFESGLPPNQSINVQNKDIQNLGTMRSGETWWLGFSQDVSTLSHYWTADDGLLLVRSDAPNFNKVDFLAPTVTAPKVVNIYHYVMSSGGLIQEHYFSITVQPPTTLSISTQQVDFGEVNISSPIRENPNTTSQRSVTLKNEGTTTITGNLTVEGTGFSLANNTTSTPLTLAPNESKEVLLFFKAWSEAPFTGRLSITHNAPGTQNPLVVSLTGKGITMPPSIWGYVKDEAGTPIAGVTVRLSEYGGTRKITTLTDANGRYRIDAQVGYWDLSIGNSFYDEHPDYLFILNSNGKYGKSFQIIGGESIQEDFTAKPKDKSIVPEPVVSYPANGAIDIAYRPTLRWNSVTAPSGTTVRYTVKWYVGDPVNPTSYGEWGPTTNTFYDVAANNPNFYPSYNRVFNWCVQANFQPSLPSGKSLSTCTPTNSFRFLPRNPVTYATLTSNVTATTAILKGNWSDTSDAPINTYWFVYGTDVNNLNLATVKVNLTEEESVKAKEVTANITALLPNTTYYFRLITQNAAGVSYSRPEPPTIASFKTTPASGYTISGRATLHTSSTALEGVVVALKNTTIPPVQTNSAGDYVITGLNNGNYTLQASKVGYQFDDLTNLRIVDGSLIRNLYARRTSPSLLSPTNGQNDVSINPILTWSSVPTATEYEIGLYLNAEHNGSFVILRSKTNSIKLYNLPNGMQFYWNVVAIYPEGQSRNSSADHSVFSTESQQPISITVLRNITTKFRNASWPFDSFMDVPVGIVGSDTGYTASLVSCSGNWLTFFGGQTGKSGENIQINVNSANTGVADRLCTLRVTATGTSVYKDFVLKQAGTGTNNPPVVKNAIPNQTVALGGAALILDLKNMNIFQDADGDNLNMWQSYGANVTTTLVDGMLVIYPKAIGAETLKIFAYDGIEQVETSFVVNVVATMPNPTTTVMYALQGNWNMVSLPVSVTNPAPTSVFSTAIANTLNARENGGYILKPSLETCKAYWLKTSGAGNTTVSGTPVTTCTYNLVVGWNMIAAPNCSLP